ncbi:MAG: peptidase M23 [Bacteroidetes bacterium 4572_77]|nr:MAG: peptidase M23 [Bacteroidetes bacterium 4572_77]
MVKRKYVYNPKTLSYDPIKPHFFDYVKIGMGFIVLSLMLAIGIVISFSSVYDTPEEAQLKRKNTQLQELLQSNQQQLEDLCVSLNEVQQKDDQLYRILLGEDPLPQNIRLAGIGGAHIATNNEFSFSSYDVNKANARIAVQSASFDELTYLALKQQKEIESQPKIFPLHEKDLIRFASKFGYRIHPIFKIRKLHKGVDLSAKTGTLVYATASGKVIIACNAHDGYGNKIVIDHGNGYKTVYAHLNKINVKVGQEVQLASIIGQVGNTGRSVAPHLHYEVRVNNQPVDPVDYFYRDFSDSEFDALIALAN